MQDSNNGIRLTWLRINDNLYPSLCSIYSQEEIREYLIIPVHKKIVNGESTFAYHLYAYDYRFENNEFVCYASKKLADASKEAYTQCWSDRIKRGMRNAKTL